MKKVTTLLCGLLITMILPAQGVYQLWGMTHYGGAFDAGTIFKTNDRGILYQTVHNFSSIQNSPGGRLTYYNNKLYGMSVNGGAFGKGVIFEIDPVTGIYTEKLSRTNDIDGRTGVGTLIVYGNKLYGGGEGGNYNQGVIFEWDPVTNIYTKKIDLTGTSGSAPGYLIQSLTLVGNKFYGSTRGGGTPSGSILFEWDPVTNIYTSKINPGYGTGLAMEAKDSKLYGTLMEAGANGLGAIFEWDLTTNTFTKKIDFTIHGSGGTPGIEGSQPLSGLTLCGDKFYGTTIDGGYYQKGVLYEWDPVTNLPSEYDPVNNRYIVKHDFDGINTGSLPQLRLSAIGGRIYGIVPFGGVYDLGIFFEFDPVTNVFTKRRDFQSPNGNPAGTGENGVIAVPLSVASGTTGICANVGIVTIDNSNNNKWVPILNNLGLPLAELNANGNNLGIVSTQLYIHNGTLREDGGKKMYLDRSLTITPQVQPSTPVDIRLYIKDSELEELKTATNSQHYPSWVNTINDIAIFQNNDPCNGSLVTATPLPTTNELWLNGFVLSASVNNFSSFYLAGKSAAPPLTLLEFNGQLVLNDALLNWETDNELGSSHFEIERSVDARNFSFMGQVNAANTPGVHNYSFTDQNIASLDTSLVYYRLKLRDTEGRFAYSPVVTVLVHIPGIYSLWGMTSSGGTAGSGVIFRTSNRGNNFQKIYDFAEAGMGLNPWGHLTHYNGKMYGITSTGGTYGLGVIFEIDPVTNSYTKKIDFSNDIDGIVGVGSLVLYGTKLYGIGGSNGMSLIFEWDPVTNIYAKNIDSSGISASGYSLTVAGNKFYGLTGTNGINSSGVLFEWDPATNLYTKKLDFTGLEGAYPSPYGTALELKDGKLYGTGLSGGDYRLGVIFEWDPVTNIHTMKHDFDGGNTGRNPMSRLCAFGGRLYGMMGDGGINNKGLLFELDPINNVFTKKLDFDGINAGYSSEGNKIIAVPAPVSTGTPGSCITLTTVTIDSSNNNEWVPVVDNLGHAVAEIKANGNNLGVVTSLLYVHNGAIREDAAHQMYLDRNLTITPQVQPATPVDIRLYIRDAELETLKTATNSLGRPSWVYSISDLAIFKNEDACSPAVLTRSDPVLTTAETWTGGYVLVASVDNFSSFYFANKANSALPLDLISFTGKLVDNVAVLNWRTDNEINNSHFEIERSPDGRNYSLVGKVNSFNTPGAHNYIFTDVNVATAGAAVIYYRLKQIDIDGRFTYSDVVVLRMEKNNGLIFYPNPVTNKANLIVTINTPEQFQLRVIDNIGRVIKQQQWNVLPGSTSLSIDAKGLANGLYYVELKGKAFTRQLTFLKQ